MKMTIDRVYQNNQCTLGILRFDDLTLCTLEDPSRYQKIPGKTRIPAGTYDLTLRRKSPMADRYRERFGQQHYGMIWLQDVPDFQWVYFHIGNDAEDTEGCILVGDAMSPYYNHVTNSVRAYSLLSQKLIPYLHHGHRVRAVIRDEFPA